LILVELQGTNTFAVSPCHITFQKSIKNRTPNKTLLFCWILIRF
jgi:hypothetical protein